MNKSLKLKKKFYNDYGWWIYILMWILPLVDIRFGLLWLLSMILSITFSLFSPGKLYCAYFCPRGSGFQKFLKNISLNKPVPKFLKNKVIRYGFTAFLTIQVIRNVITKSSDLNLLGGMIYRGFIWTSILALVLGFLYKPRVYCGQLCHAGNLAGFISRFKSRK
ncbi:MAG: hypothetical protein DSY38_01950 [Fusobacteria bacterium]|nr:MAG: hypothetical protein DSY38_01950 [Fusobacteriota bacterium]